MRRASLLIGQRSRSDRLAGALQDSGYDSGIRDTPPQGSSSLSSHVNEVVDEAFAGVWK